jgi:hypothetical protein
MQRLFKLNSVLIKYNNFININIYKSFVLHKLLYQARKPFFEEDYIIVEDTIKINDKNIEDDWVEINNDNYDLK